MISEIEKINTKRGTSAEVLKVIKVNNNGTFNLEDEYEEDIKYYEVKKGVDINITEKDNVIIIFINNNPNNPVIIGSL